MMDQATTTPEKEIPEDDFIKSLKTETKLDQDGAPSQPEVEKGPTTAPKGKPEVDDDDDDGDGDLDELSSPALVTDILVETLDLVHNIAMQTISGEPNPDLFKVPAQGKKRIKKATTKLIEKYNWNVHPGFVLLLLVIVVYGPSTVRGMAIRKQKIREKKIKNGEVEKENFEVKRGPGRPPGSTKDKSK
jgi:hypothetical protein